ncbi:MAG: hypothetical protein HYY36_00460 [Gammaproteobacteria bacterium]|nr:hypothetical protein [Gammaproteobacteria bacterium]
MQQQMEVPMGNYELFQKTIAQCLQTTLRVRVKLLPRRSGRAMRSEFVIARTQVSHYKQLNANAFLSCAPAPIIPAM